VGGFYSSGQTTEQILKEFWNLHLMPWYSLLEREGGGIKYTFSGFIDGKRLERERLACVFMGLKEFVWKLESNF